jgi:hypothetical protein
MVLLLYGCCTQYFFDQILKKIPFLYKNQHRHHSSVKIMSAVIMPIRLDGIPAIPISPFVMAVT